MQRGESLVLSMVGSPGAPLLARGDGSLNGHLPLRTGFQSDGGVLELESTALSSR